MPFPITIFDTSVDADRFETLEVTATPVTSNPISGARTLIVSTADVFIDIGLEPDSVASYALVPAGFPIMFGLHHPHEDKVSIRTVAGTGTVTVYHI